MQRWFFVEPEENEKIRTQVDIEPPLIGDFTNYSEKHEWLFQVKVTEPLRPDEVVCVTGNCKELGNWNPDNCIPLTEVIKADSLWSKSIWLPKHEYIEYRYCIVTFVAPCPHGIVRRWETSIHPRRIPKAISVSPTIKDQPEEFGYYDNITKIDRGWVSRDTVVQFKFFNNPITLWRPKLADRLIYIKVTPVTVNKHDMDGMEDASLSMDTQESSQPRAHTQTEVSSLTAENNSFQSQEQFGTPYHKNDYLLFQTSVIQPQNVAYLFDFYMYSSHASEVDPPQHIGFSYVLASSLKSEGHLIVPITSVKQRPLGEFRIDYIVVTALKDYCCDLQVSYARHWKSSWAGLDVAHRGLGSNFVDTKRCAEVRENTIASLKTAIAHGADFVEFDVQLSKDHIPIIYHDFYVLIAMKRKKLMEDADMLEIPVKDLTLAQLHLLKDDLSMESCIHKLKAICIIKDIKINSTPCASLGLPVYHLEEDSAKPQFFDEELEEHQPFPTLHQALSVLDPHAGFNIEIKWTMQLKDGTFELNNPIDLNLYLDKILDVVLRYGGERRIIFSSFNPDICTIIRLKQNKYPVMFLTQGQTVKYPSYHDPRCMTIQSAVQYAVAMNILGVTVHSEDILRDASQIKLALNAGLVTFCWGTDNNDPAIIKHLKQIGLHGVIFDKIDEFSEKEVKESIFLVEARESQKRQFLAIAEQNAPVVKPTCTCLGESFAESVVEEKKCFIDIAKARVNLGEPGVSTATSLESLKTEREPSLEEQMIDTHLTHTIREIPNPQLANI